MPRALLLLEVTKDGPSDLESQLQSLMRAKMGMAAEETEAHTLYFTMFK